RRWRGLVESGRRSEDPVERHERFGIRGTGGTIGGEGGGVVGLRSDPHAIAAAAARELRQRSDQFAADALVAMIRSDGELVQEHLGPFVRVSRLYAGDEAHGIAVRVQRDEQVMVVA